ncbi:MAG: TldD/PmbA family protein [Candidatus Methylomirabilota bacterium]|nr:MAG: TldD/PmbA family protein [candidate division NC10 bacterium]
MSFQPMTIEIIDQIRPMIVDLATRYRKSLRGCRYADIRVQVDEGQAAAAENGGSKHSTRDYTFAIGIRALSGNGMIAPGYFGQSLGAADLDRLAQVVKDGLRHAHHRALANAERKSATREGLDALGDALTSTSLAPIDIHQDTVPAQFEIDPRTVPLEELVALTTEVSRSALALDPHVKYTFISAYTLLTRELFCSSEGANIDQAFAMTQGTCFIVAHGASGTQELYDYMGHQRGWEVLTRGVHEESIRFPDFQAFSIGLANDAVSLCNARPLKPTNREAVVVTDPHYNTLLVHEIVGHPMELDRALKLETSYAGRSWLFRNMQEHQLGKPIASPLVSAFSDPSLPGYGHYKYDHEGTPATRVTHIDRGIFRGFMNSRQTAAILGVSPNGSYKATDASLVPLIRMSNTVFGPGERDPQEMIREIPHGYYLVGHRTPSIAESRENFRITAMKVYEIKNGQIGELFCNGGIMADTKDYLMQVDAVGNDFRLYPIPNCGKGQPMQTKRLGNGGPTMRSRARLTGISK